MTKKNKKESKTKEHMRSGIITFVVAFALSIAATVGDTSTAVTLEQSALLSAIAVALRAATKEVITYLTTLMK
jgi:heme/copper-type cytochrome/quinol oxidase subunit 4